MNFHVRFGALLDQEPNASRLIAGKILIDDTSAGENQRKLFIRNFVGRIVFNRVKLGLAVGMIKAIFKQTRRAWMIFSGTRPEDPIILFNSFPRNAVVVGITAARSNP